MVVFTCNHCGDSLQKPRVEKHYNMQCRNPKSLTCVDCLKDFKGEDYVAHIKCMTEEERYAAKGSIPGGIVKKGEVKQESWTDMIRSIVDNETNMKSSLKNLFETISSYTNVPRKKAKFLNFLRNSLGSRVHFYDVEEAWNLIEKYKNDQPKANGQEVAKSGENGVKHKSDGDNEEVPPKKKKLENKINQSKLENAVNGNTPQQNGESKKKKKKHSSEENSDETSSKKLKENEDEVNVDAKDKNEVNGSGKHTDQSNGATKAKKKKSKEDLSEDKQQKDNTMKQSTEDTDIFSFKDTILNILKEKGSISAKKLQKKVLNKYVQETGNEYTEKIIKKYNKKLEKLSNIVIDNDTVSLSS